MLVLILTVLVKNVVFIMKSFLKVTVIKYSIYFTYTMFEHPALNTNLKTVLSSFWFLLP